MTLKLHVFWFESFLVSPLLEGPQSLSGRDLSENLETELQFSNGQCNVTSQNSYFSSFRPKDQPVYSFPYNCCVWYNIRLFLTIYYGPKFTVVHSVRGFCICKILSLYIQWGHIINSLIRNVFSSILTQGLLFKHHQIRRSIPSLIPN